MSEQRAEFVALATQPGANRRALCRHFGIAPATAYKWLGRYAAEGVAGLQNRSRRPRHSPSRTPVAIEQAVLALRAQYPAWGGRKLRVLLARQGIQPLPAASTITAILRRHAALDPTQRAGQPRALQRFEHPVPNALWQMDFKAGWPCGTGRCHPLTILDDHSRYALGVRACPNQRTATVQTQLIATFQRYGLPDRLLVDNGSPWGNHPAHPYTPLTVWLRRLGIAVSHSRPYRPQTLGKDERFHGTLQRELGRLPRPADLAAWQVVFDAWREQYNHVRPHESLDLAVPASRYHVSPRPYPSQLPPLPYGPADHVRRVQAGGWVTFQGHRLRLAKALRGQPVAFRPTATDGCWAIRFVTDDLGLLNLRDLA
jgi:transposase InsO family protein